tara:strand:- start:624 stop:944 length:321 start_codon:yes stop_codon:yes gene_type:complete
MIELDIAGGLATVTLTMPISDSKGENAVRVAVARAWGLNRTELVKRPDLDDSPCFSLDVGPSRIQWAAKPHWQDRTGNDWCDNVDDVMSMLIALCKKHGAEYEVVN